MHNSSHKVKSFLEWESGKPRDERSVYVKYLKGMNLSERIPTLFDEGFSKRALGPFFKRALPRTASTLDMRFAELPEDTPDLLNMNPSSESHYVLVGPSGCGKTRSIFDTARRYFTVLFECGTMEDGIGVDPGPDRLFMKFFDDVLRKSDELGVQELKGYVRWRMALEVASRLLYLRVLFDTKEDLTPEEYLVCQMNTGQQRIASIGGYLSGESFEDLHVLVEKVLESLEKDVLKNQGRIVFAVDRAHVGDRLLKDTGIWKNAQGQCNRGVLTPVIQYMTSLSHAPCTIFAGTSLSLLDTITSDIGKPKITTIVKDFPQLTLEDILKRFNMWLQLDQIDLTSSYYFKCTQGRPRFSEMIPIHIQINIEQERMRRAVERTTKTLDKEDLWDTALRENHKLIKGGITKLLQLSLRKTNRLGYASFLQKIEKLYVGAKLGNGIVQVEPDEELIKTGLACLHSGIDRDYCTVREPLAMETLVAVWEKELNLTFRQILCKQLENSINPVGEGYHFQTICACLIKSFTDPDSTIYDFLYKLYGKQTKKFLPSWTKKASFTIQSFGNCKELGFMDDNSTISHMFSKSNHGLLLLPGEQTTPHLLSVNSLAIGSEYWGLQCITQLNTSILSRPGEYDKGAYEEGTKEEVLQIDFENVEKGRVLKCLKLHIILPRGTKKELIVQPNEDVVAYIDIDIFKKLCGDHKEVYQEDCEEDSRM